MKFFALFSAIVAVAMSSPTTWTIHELSEAIQNPATVPALIPILEQALDELMLEAFSGNNQPETTVSTAVQELSLWTLHELSVAIQDPSTDPSLLPYLEHALDSMMFAIMSGNDMNSIVVVTPVGLLTPESPVVSPVVVAEPAETPVSSPLVQIIVNVNGQQQVAPTPVKPVVPTPVTPQEPVVVPNPVDVIAINPVVAPTPVKPVVPTPVMPVNPVVVPNPVDVIAITPPQAIINPVDIIAINPETAINPVDVIAIAAPEVNPILATAPVGPIV